MSRATDEAINIAFAGCAFQVAADHIEHRGLAARDAAAFVRDDLRTRAMELPGEFARLLRDVETGRFDQAGAVAMFRYVGDGLRTIADATLLDIASAAAGAADDVYNGD